MKVMIENGDGREALLSREGALMIPVFFLLFPSATSHHSDGIRPFVCPNYERRPEAKGFF